MNTLGKDTAAIHIHPISKQELQECTVPNGTAYTFLHVYTDALGFHWQVIAVDGSLYLIEDKGGPHRD